MSYVYVIMLIRKLKYLKLSFLIITVKYVAQDAHFNRFSNFSRRHQKFCLLCSISLKRFDIWYNINKHDDKVTKALPCYAYAKSMNFFNKDSMLQHLSVNF